MLRGIIRYRPVGVAGRRWLMVVSCVVGATTARDAVMAVNKELLQTVLGLVELAAEHRNSAGGWYQGLWRSAASDLDDNACGTAMCFAGWTPIALNRKYVSDLPGRGFSSIIIAEDDVKPLVHKEDENGYRVCDSDSFVFELARTGDEVHVSDWARAQLGLNDLQSDRLFASYNDLDNLRGIVSELVELEGEE